MKETTVLVGLISKNQNEEQVSEYLDELAFLAETAGAETLKRFTQRLEHPDSKTFIGSGKLEQIRVFMVENNVKLAIFDDELSGSQIRNIEKILDCRVLDRNNLILDIFANRARTAQAKAQVELAQYQYLLPRLTRMWTHLEKQRGGIGMRGLEILDKQEQTRRKTRGELVRVALVGYTNVGKSTLMTLLSKSEVFAENKLFATLDTTVRKIVYDRIPFLLSDTVGFIRKLPHDLIESFKSTLDEVREADILLHVVDISHPQFEDQINVVNQTLVDIKAGDKKVILVLNKIDAYKWVEKEEDDLTPSTRENISLEELKRSWMSRIDLNCIFISAAKKTNIEELREKILKEVKKVHYARYPNAIQ